MTEIGKVTGKLELDAQQWLQTQDKAIKGLEGLNQAAKAPSLAALSSKFDRLRESLVDPAKLTAIHTALARLEAEAAKGPDPTRMRQLRAEVDTLEKSFKGLSGSTDQSLASMTKAGAGMALGAAGVASFGVAAMKALQIMQDSIGAASDLRETVNKVDVVFTSAAGTVKEFAEGSADAFGQSKQQALEAAAGFGNLFKTMGTGESAAASMSTQVVRLASDLASFHNIGVDVALEKLRSGLVGEAEPMRQLGVLLDETTVSAKAMAMGLGTSAESLSQSAKVQARYQLILEQTKDAQGDFARTSDGLANSQRILEARSKDLQARLGSGLLPAAQAVNFALLAAVSAAGGTADALGKIGSVIGKVFVPAAEQGASSTKKLNEQLTLMAAHKVGVDHLTDSMAKFGTLTMRDVPKIVNVLNPLSEKFADMEVKARRALAVIAEAEMAAGAQAPTWSPAKAAGEANAAAIRSRMIREWERSGSLVNIDLAVARAVDAQEDAGRTAYFVAAAEKEAASAAKSFASAAESAGEKAQNAFEKAAEAAEDIAQKMDEQVATSQIKVMNLAEDLGERWVAKWGEVDQAIHQVQRSAEESLAAIDDQEALNESIARRRANLDERLSGEDRLFRQKMDDEEYHHQESVRLAKIDEKEKRALAGETDEEKKREIRAAAQKERDALREAHADYDAEVQWRIQQENKQIEWRKYLENERATLERELHEEELNRRRAAIDEEKEAKIKSLNDEWDKWQTTEKAKTDKLTAEEKARALAKLTALRDGYFQELAKAAAPGLEALKAQIDATLSASVGGLVGDSSGGDEDPFAGVDPEHRPGGSVFDAWWGSISDEEKDAFRSEHPGWGLARGGSWTVGGGGGTDSQLVRFMATPGERVTVTPPDITPLDSILGAATASRGGDTFSFRIDARESAVTERELYSYWRRQQLLFER